MRLIASEQLRLIARHLHAVGGGDGADVVGTSDGTGDRSLLVGVVKTLAAEEGGATLRELEDDGGLVVTSTLEGGVDGGRRGNVLARVSTE